MQERLVSATEAVRRLSASCGGDEEARRHIVRECQSGRLIAVAEREIVRTLVDTVHRERLRTEELLAIGKTLLPHLAPSETVREDCKIALQFWRAAFDPDGLPIDDWRGTARADWRTGDFTLKVYHRNPGPGWQGDKGDWTETQLIGVRFPTNRAVKDKENRPAQRPVEIPRNQLLARAAEIRSEHPTLGKGAIALSLSKEMPPNPRTGKERDPRHLERLIAPLWPEGGK